MKWILPLILLASPAAAQNVQTRCGWYSNPTPANYDLVDADGLWSLSVQGRGEAQGFYDATAAAGGRSEWVTMSPAGYGYGCACIDGIFGNVEQGEVLRVLSLTHLPLAQCASDPALPHRDLKPMEDGG